MKAKNQSYQSSTSSNTAKVDQTFLVKGLGIEIVESHFVMVFAVQILPEVKILFDSSTNLSQLNKPGNSCLFGALLRAGGWKETSNTGWKLFHKSIMLCTVWKKTDTILKQSKSC